MNKLVKRNLVRGLPSKHFENDQTCVACQKEKQYRASYKTKTENSINLPLYLLHMELFGPTFVKSLMKKMYCLVVTDDFSRFTWVFFLATKDVTRGILKSFITRIENLVYHTVKVIRCDNGTEFKNREMNQFCEMKGILRQLNVARTPQQNRVAKRRNMTLIEADRTMLADSKLPATFWAEAINTASYMQNRVLVVKPHTKTPYELFYGRTLTISFMRPFGCPVTILNTKDHLGKFDGKADEGFFVGHFLNSKTFRVFNSRTRIVEENLHIRFSESTPNVVGSRPDWLFDIDALTRTMNYEPIVTGTQSNGFAGTKASDNACQARKEIELVKEYILLPLWIADPPFSQDLKSFHDDGFKPSNNDGKKVDEDPRKQKKYNELPFNPNMPALEDVGTFDFSNKDEDDDIVADINNMDKIIQILWCTKWMSRVLFYRKIEEEVYVCQPPGFEDPDFPDRVYKVEKHCMDYIKLLKHGDILLVRVYVDDIIFGSTRKELCNEFERLMHEKFQMSSVGELTFFLGLQVKQKIDSIFISQDKYVAEILKKFRFTEVKNASTPMKTQKPLLKVEDEEEVDVYMYRIFRYLKGQPKLGFWYPKDSPFDLVVYTDSDYARASLDRKSTTGDGKDIIITESSVRRDLRLADEEGVDSLSNSTIFENLKLMGKVIEVPQPSKPIKHVADEAVNKELADRLVRAATIASSLEVKQDSGNIDMTQSKAKPNKASSPGNTLVGGLRCQEAIGDTIAQTRFKNVSKLSNDSLLVKEKTKTTQALEITSLKRRVKKLEKKQRSRTHKLKRLYKVGLTARVGSSKDEQSLGEDASKQGRKINEIDVDEDITLVNDQDDAEIFEVSAAGEVNAASITTTVSADVTITTDEITLAQALVEIKTSKPKTKGIVLQEPSESITTTTIIISSKKSQDKEKRRKHFAAKAAEEKRNKPPTQVEQRKIMCTSLKNVERKKLKNLKNKSFDSIQKMFDRSFNRVNTFLDFRTELVEGSSKRAGEELTQESTKKQKVDDDKETTKLKELMEIILDK
uniref:Putative ribonuclease H-like domain-containing protein n=1 Tax=Tanacetum cinerariifolium TaxID=118510 RepID=A0A6L2NEU0_TANCI|nr:putative ribonuclease H-like domain-containing protein [Tanacetum cinerariifolium]